MRRLEAPAAECVPSSGGAGWSRHRRPEASRSLNRWCSRTTSPTGVTGRGGRGRPRRARRAGWGGTPAAGCSSCTASDHRVPPDCWSKSVTSPVSPTATTSRPGPAPLLSMPRPETESDTGCPVAATVRSTGSCTPWPPSSFELHRRSRLLRPQEGRRKVLHRGHALLETTTVRRGLPRHGGRPRSPEQDRSGRATRQRL
jgi:hypothetical protein